MTKINYVFKDSKTGIAHLIQAGSRAEAYKLIGPGTWEVIDSWIEQINTSDA